MDLPPRHLVHTLVHSFLDAFQWYHAFFDEQSLWPRINSLLDSQSVNVGQEAFLLLTMIVLVTGIRYLPAHQAENLDPSIDLDRLQVEMLDAIDRRTMAVLDEISTDCIIFLFLLCSHNLFNRRPSRAFIMFGAAVRTAQAAGLHNEAQFEHLTLAEREVCRSLWWSIYVADG